VKRQAFNGTDLKMTGLNVPVAYNTNKVLDVYAVIAAIGTGNAAAGQDVGVSLYAMKHRNSNGVETTVPGLSLSSNSFYAYKTKPTIALSALPSTVLNPGTQTIAKFSITSDAGGPISWRKLVMSYATATPSGTFTLSNFNIYEDSNQSTPLTGVTVTVGTGSNTTVTFTSSSTDQQVSGTKTYVIKADIGGTGIVTGASLQTSFTNSGETFTAPTNAGNLIASTARFVWSDESVIPHSDTSADWNNGFLVKNLPTDSQTMTK
jgi:hypothetical protein